MPSVLDTTLYKNVRRDFLGSVAWGTLRAKLRQYWLTPPPGTRIRWDSEDVNVAMSWMQMPEGRDYWYAIFELQNQLNHAIRTRNPERLAELRSRVVEPLNEEPRRAEEARRQAEFAEALQRTAEHRRAAQAEADQARMKKYAKVYD